MCGLCCRRCALVRSISLTHVKCMNALPTHARSVDLDQAPCHRRRTLHKPGANLRQAEQSPVRTEAHCGTRYLHLRVHPPMDPSMARPQSFDRDALLACARGELFGPGNARLPAPPMLMFDRITHISEDGGAHHFE